jgi:hypothetical protein
VFAGGPLEIGRELGVVLGYGCGPRIMEEMR